MQTKHDHIPVKCVGGITQKLMIMVKRESSVLFVEEPFEIRDK